MEIDQLVTMATAIANTRNSDILLFNGGINTENAENLIKICKNKAKKDNILLMLITEGGSADAAFRIARCLQQEYQNFTVFVPGWCKSAGTLIAIGANNIIISDYGELGPLDVQLSKTDELWEYNSGLTVNAALDYLQDTAFSMFEQYMVSIKSKSGNRISFKTSTDISLRFVVELLKPIYDKIEPEKIGDISRSMMIAYAYGQRLNLASDNLVSDESLQLLVSSYPSHGFVIDKEEACALFRNVESPDAELERLADGLGNIGRYPAPEAMPILQFLNADEIVGTTEEDSAAEEDNAPANTNAVPALEEALPTDCEPQRGEVAEVHQRGARRSTRASKTNESDQASNS